MTLSTDAPGLAADRFWFLTYRRGGQDACSAADGDLTMIFCLQGNVAYQSRSQEYSMGAGYFTVIDKRAIVASACPPGTALLKYALPPFLSAYMIEWMGVFETPVFPVVPIDPQLAAWADSLIRGMARGESGYYYAGQRRALALRLTNYPSGELGGMYVPLSTCIRHCAGLAGCPFVREVDRKLAYETDFSSG